MNRGTAALLSAVLVVGALFVVVQLHAPAGSVDLAQAASAAAAPIKAAAPAHKQLALAAQVHGPRSAKRVAAVPVVPLRAARKAKKVISGKAIFARMVKVLGKVAKAQRSK